MENLIAKDIIRIINQGRAIEDEQNLKECINKCKKLQMELLNSIYLIEWSYLELESKSEQTHLP